MPKIAIPLKTDEAVRGLLRVKPTADMPRPSDFRVTPKRKKKAKKVAG